MRRAHRRALALALDPVPVPVPVPVPDPDPAAGSLRARGPALARAALDEALHQAVVERVAQVIFDGAGALLPRARVGDPERAMRDVRPGPDRGDPREQRVEIALGIVDLGEALRQEPSVEDRARTAELRVDLGEQRHVRVEQELAKIGDAAHLPQQPDGLGPASAGAHRRILRERDQRREVLGVLDEPERVRARTLPE